MGNEDFQKETMPPNNLARANKIALARPSFFPSGAGIDNASNLKIDQERPSIMQGFATLYRNESGRIILWAPVFFAFGAALGCGARAGSGYSILLFWVGLFALLLVALSILPKLRHSLVTLVLRAICAFALILQLGALVANLRAEAVSAPIISASATPYQLYGKIFGADRNSKGVWRAKILVSAIGGLRPESTPKYVRVSVNEMKAPIIGANFKCSAVLRPPPLPVIPHSFDFARKAWFLQIGGVGYCQGQPIIKTNEANASSFDFQKIVTVQRLRISELLAGGQLGGGSGFLAAVTTGDRSWISPEDMTALQASGLGHIVSVSGLHVGLISAIVYFALLKILALIGPLALRVDIRKIAALLSFITALCYTIFTGAEAPAVRAALMAGVSFGAILLNRRAISMRGLGVAALALLLLRPENSIDAGFQMSFLATMALVALWENIDFNKNMGPKNIVTTSAKWILGAIGASFVAGIATMPVALHSFGRITTYSLFANILSAPINDFIVGPFALLGAVFSTFNFGGFFFDIAKWGLSLVLSLSYFFASLPNANILTQPLNEFATFLLVLSTIWVCLFRTKLRYFSIFFTVFAGIIWINTAKPRLLIAPNANAFLSLVDNNYKICFLQNGRFDANRLISAANLDDLQIANLNAQMKNRSANKCSAGEGDWEVHYVYGDRAPKQTNLNSAISLTFNNQSHGIDKNTAPYGAILTRKNWRLLLEMPQNSKAPWLQQAR